MLNHLPPPAHAHAQAQPAQAQPPPPPPPPDLPLLDASASKTLPTPRSTPLRLTKPPLPAREGSMLGEMEVASEAIVFSVQPAKPAVTLLTLGVREAPPPLEGRPGALLPPPTGPCGSSPPGPW